MSDSVAEYLKAVGAFVALLATGIALLAFGYKVEGKSLLVAAPVTSGLVAALPNQPRARRHRARGRRRDPADQ